MPSLQLREAAAAVVVNGADGVTVAEESDDMDGCCCAVKEADVDAAETVDAVDAAASASTPRDKPSHTYKHKQRE